MKFKILGMIICLGIIQINFASESPKRISLATPEMTEPKIQTLPIDTELLPMQEVEDPLVSEKTINDANDFYELFLKTQTIESSQQRIRELEKLMRSKKNNKKN